MISGQSKPKTKINGQQRPSCESLATEKYFASAIWFPHINCWPPHTYHRLLNHMQSKLFYSLSLPQKPI
jgi:hypothetical protein